MIEDRNYFSAIPHGATMTTTSPSATEIIGGPERFLKADLSQQIQFLAARARAKGTAKGNAALEDLNLKVRQYSALSIAASGLKPTQRELGVFLDLDPSQIVALIDFLEDRGLVTREADPRDRRSKIIVATTSGLEIHEDATQRLLKAESDSLKNLSSAERELLRELLLKIAF